MWYRTAQQRLPLNRLNLTPEEWELMVKQPSINGVTNETQFPGDPVKNPLGDESQLDSPGVDMDQMSAIEEGMEARRQSPLHSVPEITPLEKQLETARHENMNAPGSPSVDTQLSMPATEGGRGWQQIRGKEKWDASQSVQKNPNIPMGLNILR